MNKWIIDQARVYNTFRQTFEEKSVLIEGDTFKQILNVEDVASFDDVKIVNAKGLYMVPGLIDIHMHIESSMTIPSQFSKAALRFGTTTIVSDPHEIANVFGKEGIYAFMAADTNMDIYYGIPSSVPSTTVELETTGGVITEKEVLELLDHPKVVCLGEVMNFKDLVSEEDTLTKRIIASCKQKRPNMPLEGHCPKISGADLQAYIASGVNADHTQQTAESIHEKIQNGMFLEIQMKSVTKETVQALLEYDGYYSFVTDDVMPDLLVKGQLNNVLLKAYACGMPLEKALYHATYTPALRMQLFDRGLIAVGKKADFSLLHSLEEWKTHSVYKDGEVVYHETGFVKEEKEEVYPKHFYESLKCKPLELSDLKIKSEGTKVIVNAIQGNLKTTFTELTEVTLPIKDGFVDWQNQDLSLLLCIERYGKSNRIAYAFVKGLIHSEGALATSWAHDHHNLMVMGTNDQDILKAAQHILDLQGGYCVVKNEEVLASASLNVGGIVSDRPIEELANDIKNVRKAMEEQLEYTHYNAVMSFATLSLPVSPFIKLTDRGMVIGKTLEIVPLIKEVIYED